MGAYVDGDLTSPASSAASASVEIGGLLAEVAERRGLGAVEAVAEIHLVQIELEDLALLELALDPRRDDDSFILRV